MRTAALTFAALLSTAAVARAQSVGWDEPVAPLAPQNRGWSASASLLGGLADAFYAKVSPVISVRRGFGAISAELFVSRAFSWAAPSFEICSAAGDCRVPSESELGAVPGQLGLWGGGWAVLRGTGGKVSVAGGRALRFLTEAGLGVAAVEYFWRDGVDHRAVAPAMRWGVGAGMHLGESWEMRAELGGLLHPTTVRDVTSLHHQLLFGASVGWRWGEEAP
jgi:hypothetical protein